MKEKDSGYGFSSLKLNKNILKGLFSQGFKQPTPIQRKIIPLILNNKDVIAMSRTGSGKTIGFLAPLLHLVSQTPGTKGIKALILSPTREISMQTFKVCKSFNKHLNLKIALIVGGYSMEKNFSAIHDNPDIIIATPGRLLHVLVEMSITSMVALKVVVVDECDRLFEMGFKEQLTEIFARFNENRQTLLFSATLPQMVIDFVKAGLHNPVLVRLDVECKLSENLTSHFIYCRETDKLPLLLHLLNRFIKKNEVTAVFTSTRHHVEYLKCILNWANIECSFAYSALDQEARGINIQQFRSKKVNILLVTDIAARGIDIPFLDNVINFNFPSKPKLYVHRVGRVARAGNSGTSYSFVSNEEMPYLFDLFYFLDKELKIVFNNSNLTLEDSILGTVPQEIIENELEILKKCEEASGLKKVCENATKHYIKTRALPSSIGVKCAKQMNIQNIGIHPIFNDYFNKKADIVKLNSREEFLHSIRSYKPKSTIFEIGPNRQKTYLNIMLEKRKFHDKLVKKVTQKKLYQPKLEEENNFKDNDFYLPYRPKNYFAEKGLEVDKNCEREINGAVFDINGDDMETIKKNQDILKWDRKRKKYIHENSSDPKKKKIKTESGNWISTSYKTDFYKKWKEKIKKFKDNNNEKDEADDEAEEIKKEKRKRDQQLTCLFKNKRKNKNKGRNIVKNELKTKEQIVKKRIKDDLKKKFMTWRQKKKLKKV